MQTGDTRGALRNAIGLSSLALALWLVPLPAHAQDPASGSLSALLRPQRQSVDPGVAQLQALIDELQQRPHAQVAATTLQSAARELAAVQALLHEQADLERITRKKQLVWALLSLADRQHARAAAQLKLQRAQQLAAQTRAQVAAEAQARDHARRAVSQHGTASAPDASP